MSPELGRSGCNDALRPSGLFAPVRWLLGIEASAQGARGGCTPLESGCPPPVGVVVTVGQACCTSNEATWSISLGAFGGTYEADGTFGCKPRAFALVIGDGYRQDNVYLVEVTTEPPSGAAQTAQRVHIQANQIAPLPPARDRATAAFGCAYTARTLWAKVRNVMTLHTDSAPGGQVYPCARVSHDVYQTVEQRLAEHVCR